MKRCIFVMFTLLLLAVGPARAVDNQYGVWLSATTGGELGAAEASRWFWSLEGQYRRFDTFDGTRQLLARAFVGYKLGGGWRTGMRYDHFHNDSNRLGSFHENRFSPVTEWTGKGPGTSTLRVRGILEFRHIKNRSGTGVRFRPRVRFEWPMQDVDDAVWVTWVEPFFDLRETDWTDTGWNQNRIFFGARLPISNNTKLEIGYQNVLANPLELGDISNHTMFAQLRF